jgi:protein-S-isoprenylcysteine O-methyltransferase Ste14
MNEHYWKMSLFVLLLVWNLIRIITTRTSVKKEAKKFKTPIIEKFLFLLNIFGLMVIPFVAVLSSWFDFARMSLPELIRWFALVIYVPNLWFFWWCHKTLSGHWSGILEIKKDHKLVTTGPYKSIRHPMYLHFWLLVSTQGLILDNWLVLICGVLFWAILYFIRVPKEEQMMSDEFGAEYRKYVKQTGRIFPKIG